MESWKSMKRLGWQRGVKTSAHVRWGICSGIWVSRWTPTGASLQDSLSLSSRCMWLPCWNEAAWQAAGGKAIEHLALGPL